MAKKADPRTPAEVAADEAREATAKAEADAAKEAEKVAKATAKAQNAGDHPDTPSGEGLKAAAGLEGAEAAEAYAEAKRKARWG